LLRASTRRGDWVAPAKLSTAAVVEEAVLPGDAGGGGSGVATCGAGAPSSGDVWMAVGAGAIGAC